MPVDFYPSSPRDTSRAAKACVPIYPLGAFLIALRPCSGGQADELETMGERTRIRSSGNMGFVSDDTLALLAGPLDVVVGHMTSSRR